MFYCVPHDSATYLFKEEYGESCLGYNAVIGTCAIRKWTEADDI